ncbi:tyrosine-type recombinase/integrase, partial [Escherichia coli]|nr:tyrosine-type recombinase/integrase [Escherichia coli]
HQQKGMISLSPPTICNSAFRHSYIMHMLYHRQPRKVIQALAGHRDPRSMEVYTRVFALDMAATLAVPFTGDGRDAAEILRTLPPLK